MTAPEPAPAPDGQLRADPGRTIGRLQLLVGQQAGQIVQLEDVIDQLQERIGELTADNIRLQQPARTES